MLSEQEIKARIEKGRGFTRWQEEDIETDQMKKLPQPPLAKAPVCEACIRLPKNFSELPLDQDFVRILFRRRSNRVYTQEKISLLTLSFLLWAQQGVKGIRGRNYATLRTVPSGGARHPFEVYMLVLNVESLAPGLYHYLPLTHEIECLGTVDPQDPHALEPFSDALCGQSWALKGSVIFYYSIVPYRGEWRYSYDAHRPMMMDAGHVTENLYLACSALGLGTCAIAAVDHKIGSGLFGLDDQEEYIFYACPVGTVSEKNEADEQAFYAFLKEEE